MSVLLTRPPLPVIILMALGLVDLVSTVVLYELGLIEELNPLMRPLLEASAVLFVAVKLVTLVAAFAAMQWYVRKDERFVRMAATYGALAYSLLWATWVVAAHSA